MRMGMRRFTRLTNGFSKKLENHIAAISLHFMYYNFIRTHQTLRMTPAMAAKVVSSPMEIIDIVRLLEAENRSKRTRRRNATIGSACRVGRGSGSNTQGANIKTCRQGKFLCYSRLGGRTASGTTITTRPADD
jgi:hypothetical protein